VLVKGVLAVLLLLALLNFNLQVFAFDVFAPLRNHLEKLIVYGCDIDQGGVGADVDEAALLQDGQDQLQAVGMHVHQVLLLNHFVFLVVDKLLDTFKVCEVQLLIFFLKSCEFPFHLLNLLVHGLFCDLTPLFAQIKLKTRLVLLSEKVRHNVALFFNLGVHLGQVVQQKFDIG